LLLHVGIIPDGNRRWAKLRGLTLRDAYEAGYAKLKEVLRWLLDYDVKYLSFYAMSRDNCIKRGEEERGILLGLLERAVRDIEEERILEEHDARLLISGDLSLLPERLRLSLESLAGKRREGRRTVHVGICYSIQWELKANPPFPTLKLPPIDLVIRTGGMRRISGFFPLLVEYAELYFTDTLWPDFTRKELEEAIEWFKRQVRNFGR